MSLLLLFNEPAAAPTGVQTPAASRYRFGFRMTRAITIAAVLLALALAF